MLTPIVDAVDEEVQFQLVLELEVERSLDEFHLLVKFVKSSRAHRTVEASSDPQVLGLMLDWRKVVAAAREDQNR